MKGTDKIIAHIYADAQKECEAVISAADAKCAEIRREYERKAKQEYSERIRAGVKKEQERLEGLDRFARMESRKSLLALKQELVESCFDMAQDLLVSLPAEEYSAFLLKLLLRSKPVGEAQLILNAADREKFGAELVEKANSALGCSLALSEDCGDFRGGFILRAEDTELNCTAELLCSQCRGEMSAEVAKELFD